jgi:hypothetical protein
MIGCPETPVRTFYYKLCNNTEECSSQLFQGSSLKLRTSKEFLQRDGCDALPGWDISAAIEQKGRGEGGEDESEAGIFLNYLLLAYSVFER